MLFVFDVDGTLSDSGHRSHWVSDPDPQGQDWDTFYLDSVNDAPLPLADYAADLSREHPVVVLTARPAWIEEETALWLDEQGIDYVDLYLKPDETADSLDYKLGVLAGLGDPDEMVIYDDDPRIVEGLEQAGYRVVDAEEANGGL